MNCPFCTHLLSHHLNTSQVFVETNARCSGDEKLTVTNGNYSAKRADCNCTFKEDELKKLLMDIVKEEKALENLLVRKTIENLR